jgi:hypothetical protein
MVVESLFGSFKYPLILGKNTHDNPTSQIRSQFILSITTRRNSLVQNHNGEHRHHLAGKITIPHTTNLMSSRMTRL